MLISLGPDAMLRAKTIVETMTRVVGAMVGFITTSFVVSWHTDKKLLLTFGKTLISKQRLRSGIRRICNGFE
jgi:hypothetical protein